jgi:pimeloyl-ACP methyl ester carboxylesterase
MTTFNVDGLSVFYREAGPKHVPTVLLLHGLPSSSRMFEPLSMVTNPDEDWSFVNGRAQLLMGELASGPVAERCVASGS